MEDIFVTSINVNKVRHLKGLQIPLGEKRRNLIITGKNGSGKTSLLDALADSLRQIVLGDDGLLPCFSFDLSVETNTDSALLEERYRNGDFILAYYRASRKFMPTIPNHVEKVELRNTYDIDASPRQEFVKYILDLKMTEALLKTSGKDDKAKRIHDWFINFDNMLKQIFEDESVYMVFDEETFKFSLHQDGREPFDFRELSDGFAAILDVVVDIMIRMGKKLAGGLNFNIPGIVIIDEIETHLHLELQKNVLSFLTGLFPNIQFIVSTHSPFVLSSADNSTIFDLENETLVKNGLTYLPYDGIVRGYFEVDTLSRELKIKFDRYKELVVKDSLNDDEVEEIANLEMYLDEIPDYLAINITSEYQRLKTEYLAREDLLI